MPANDERSGFRRWLDRRTGLDSLLDHALDEPIPGGAKIAYVFGSGLLFLFLSQIVTGVFLAMYYVPSADHAHTTVAYIFVLVAMHVYSFRKAGAAGPVTEDPVSPKLPTKPFYPKQLVMDMGFAMLIIVALGVLAYAWPAELGPKADPSDTQFLPRPEWYYIPVFQYLKYWHGSTAVLGLLVIPGILGLLLVGLPFFDHSLERRPWKRPISVGLFTIILLSLGVLGFASHREDMRNPGLAAQLRTQHEETVQFMKAKFEPELSGGSLMAQNAALANPEATKGKAIFEREGCNACHGDNGIGTSAGPKLIGIGSKYDAPKP